MELGGIGIDPMSVFGYMGASGGGGGCSMNNQTGPLVHIYPLFNNNVHVKINIEAI